ncbi:glycosyltransferase 87 family protein [Kitasatospora sp. NPDC059795]|uniref:glycosyltransferase 87 family protein n=1 Tax=Kitasatospora sp. NPDC059795 TaxID=3346949 RepID=UPI0036693A9B
MSTTPLQLLSHQRWLWPAGWLLCAGWAAAFPLLSPLGPHRDWGVVAAFGYLLAAALSWHRNGRLLSALVALVASGLLPLAHAVLTGEGQSEVTVIGRAGASLLTHGSPYLASPASVLELTPYLPAMAAFGLPRALLGPHAALGDPRLWCAATFLATAGGTWRVLRRGGRSAPHRTRSQASCALALVASPVVALPLAVSGVDLPMTGLLCLALALASRRQAGGAGLALAVACAIKWTAWPAVPVAVALLAAVAGRRAAWRCAGVAVTVATALIAPWMVLAPGPMLRQVFAFPLGLGEWKTPAASPLPGRLLTQLVPGGWWLALALLLFGGAAVAVSLVRRPPLDAVAAADRLAVGLALAFLLAPAGRFGYLALPAFLAVFTRLLADRTRPPATVGHPSPTAPRPAAALAT